jgi:hypothetical protein
MNCIRTLAAVSVVCLLAGCMGMSASGETTGEPRVGESSEALQVHNVRSGPGFEYPVVYVFPELAPLSIVCYTWDRAGAIWFRLADGNYTKGGNVNVHRSHPACY